jgi:hypothetical protein
MTGHTPNPSRDELASEARKCIERALKHLEARARLLDRVPLSEEERLQLRAMLLIVKRLRAEPEELPELWPEERELRRQQRALVRKQAQQAREAWDQAADEMRATDEARNAGHEAIDRMKKMVAEPDEDGGQP